MADLTKTNPLNQEPWRSVKTRKIVSVAERIANYNAAVPGFIERYADGVLLAAFREMREGLDAAIRVGPDRKRRQERLDARLMAALSAYIGFLELRGRK